MKPGKISCEGICINRNTGYSDLATAWQKCGEEPMCTNILKYTRTGKFYLRKYNDKLNEADFGYFYVSYDSKCRGKPNI